METMKQAEVGNLSTVDLSAEITQFGQRKPWASGIASKTVFKSDDIRMVLIAMERGARMPEHHADGSLVVQVLKGSIKLWVDNQTVQLGVGQFLTLGRSIKHDVEALEDSAFLLTISWPTDSELRSLKHRGYGS